MKYSFEIQEGGLKCRESITNIHRFLSLITGFHVVQKYWIFSTEDSNLRAFTLIHHPSPLEIYARVRDILNILHLLIYIIFSPINPKLKKTFFRNLSPSLIRAMFIVYSDFNTMTSSLLNIQNCFIHTSVSILL